MRSKTRERLIAVLPTSGARRQTSERRARRTRQRHGRCRRRTSRRVAGKRHHREMAGARMKRARRRRCRTARGCCAAVRTSRVGPCASTRPVLSSTSSVQSAAARFRSCVDTTIVVPRSRLSRARSAAISSWKPMSSARRRLVEQQHVGRLRQRAGDDDALLFAAAERRELRAPRAPRCRWPRAPRARSRCRRALRARTRRGAGSGPSARSRAR